MDVIEDRETLARAAAARRDWQEALRIWDSVIAEVPEQVAGYLGKGNALREMGRLDEAEAVLAEAARRFSDNEWPAANHAGIAARRGDWPEALRRYETVCDRFPDGVSGYLGKGGALCEMGQIDPAEAVFAEASERFPTSEWAASSHAGIAARRGDWPEALRRWQTVKARFPDHAIAYVGLAQALQELERLDAADRVAAEAAERFPANEWAAIAYARSAMQRRDWEEALRRWELMLQRFPDDPKAPAGKAETLVAAGRPERARTALLAAARRFPADPSLARSLALLAARPEASREGAEASGASPARRRSAPVRGFFHTARS